MHQSNFVFCKQVALTHNYFKKLLTTKQTTMKNQILVLLTLCSFFTFAQMVVKKANGTAFVNNEVMTLTSAAFPANNVDFFVQNTSSSPIRVKIRCESITNATGADFQLCFDLCYPSVTSGGRYPGGNLNAVEIPGNTTTGNGNHFQNANPGTGTFPMDYTFRFYMIDTAGAEVGNSITVTYRFNPNLSVSSNTDLEKMGVTVAKTVTSDFVSISSNQLLSADLIDTTGKKISSKNIEAGTTAFDVSNQSAGIYFLNFKNFDGKSAVAKIIKN